MSRELLLLRHGKSDWDIGVDDFQRPLKDRGKRAAERIGVWLAQQKKIPELIITSPAERARVTARMACHAMGNSDAGIQQERRIYAAGLNELISVLGDCPADTGRVMLVGHNPGLELLLDWLTGGMAAVPADGNLLHTATLAVLRMPDDWRTLVAGCARLGSITHPATLPKTFPYPSPHGKQQRDRPAYYYTQSSVIPYRVQDGKLEILVIASSKKNHLIVPKGIREPGFSLRECAAKEAWEEAGIEGEVAEATLGSYSCEKWGATCSVAVYPMKVTRVIAEDEWQENYRGRQWMSPKKAARLLKQEELGLLVKRLEAMF